MGPETRHFFLYFSPPRGAVFKGALAFLLLVCILDSIFVTDAMLAKLFLSKLFKEIHAKKYENVIFFFGKHSLEEHMQFYTSYNLLHSMLFQPFAIHILLKQIRNSIKSSICTKQYKQFVKIHGLCMDREHICKRVIQEHKGLGNSVYFEEILNTVCFSSQVPVFF